MESHPSSSVIVGVTERRTMILSILSPPTVLLNRNKLFGNKIAIKGGGDDDEDDGQSSKDTLTCSLCLWKPSSDPNNDTLSPSLGVEEAVKKILGLESDMDLHFCHFCQAHVQNLLGFKEEVERMEERLVDMVTGLQTVLAMAHPASPQELNEDEVGTDHVSRSDEEDSDVPWLKVDKVYTLTKPQCHFPSDMDINMVETGRDDVGSTFTTASTGEEKEDISMAAKDPHCEAQIEYYEEDQVTSTSVAGCKRGLHKSSVPRSLVRRPRKKSRHDDDTILHSSATYIAARPFPCPLCPLRFIKNRVLKKHIPIHLPEEERPDRFACLHCPRRFLENGTLKDHMNTHLAPEKRPYWCDVCQTGLCSKLAFGHHVKGKVHINNEAEASSLPNLP